MKEAAVAIIRRDGKLLCITRKDDHNVWGIPGGSVENGETVHDAVVREVLEETGILITKCELIDSRKDDTGTMVHLFMVEDYIKDYAEINPKETALVGWFDKSKIYNGLFGAYNKDICEKYL